MWVFLRGIRFLFVFLNLGPIFIYIDVQIGSVDQLSLQTQHNCKGCNKSFVATPTFKRSCFHSQADCYSSWLPTEAVKSKFLSVRIIYTPIYGNIGPRSKSTKGIRCSTIRLWLLKQYLLVRSVFWSFHGIC